MADIEVTPTGQTDEELQFDVTVSEAGSTSRHVVTLQRADLDEHSDRFSSPEDFVERCMDYLLEREPKESILARFDVRDIGTYFPEFNRDVLRPRG
jgi:hypothetical protein